MAVQSAPWVGRQLSGNRYQIRAALGEGGMGIVYRAWDRNLETEVVIKVPRLSMLEEPGFVERFSREIRSLVKLTHPHIVKVLDVGSQDGIPFAVMQYLSGGSLESRRQSWADSQGRCPAGSLAGWLSEIAQALDFLHSQGFLHRDVKPANILFDGHNNAYLSDFGVIKALSESDRSARSSSLTGTGMVLGTPRYMAPEMVTGEAVDGRADQYALGVVVYELLAGQAPVDGPTPTAVLVAQTTQQPVPLAKRQPNVSPGLSQAVMRCLSKRRADRFATCGDLASAVLAGLDRREIPPAPAPSPPVRPVGAGSAAPPRSAAVTVGATPCPVCQAKLNLQPEHAGKRLRCRGCRSPLAVSRDFRELREVKAAPSPMGPPGGGIDHVTPSAVPSAIGEAPLAGGPEPLASLEMALPTPGPLPSPTQRTLQVQPNRKWPLHVVVPASAALVLLLPLLAWAVVHGLYATDSSATASSLAAAPPNSSTSAGAAPLPNPVQSSMPGESSLPPASSNEVPGQPEVAESGETADDETNGDSPMADPAEGSAAEPSGDIAPPVKPPEKNLTPRLDWPDELQEQVRRSVGTLIISKPDGVQVQSQGVLLTKPRVFATWFLPLVGAQKAEISWGDAPPQRVTGVCLCDPRLNLALLAVPENAKLASRGVALAEESPQAGAHLIAFDHRMSWDPGTAGISVTEAPDSDQAAKLLSQLTNSAWAKRAFRTDGPWLLGEGKTGASADAVGWFSGAGELIALVWPPGRGSSPERRLGLAMAPVLSRAGAERPLPELPWAVLFQEELTPKEPLGRFPLLTEELNLSNFFSKSPQRVQDELASLVKDENSTVIQITNQVDQPVAYFSYINDGKGQSFLNGDCLLLDDEGRPLLLVQYQRNQRDGVLIVLRDDGSYWLTEQIDRGKRHGWSVVYRDGIPAVLRNFRYGTETHTYLFHDGWLTLQTGGGNTDWLVSESEELAGAIDRADTTAQELSQLVYDSFQDLLKDVRNDRSRQKKIKARADSRARGAAMENVRARLGADYERTKRDRGFGS